MLLKRLIHFSVNPDNADIVQNFIEDSLQKDDRVSKFINILDFVIPAKLVPASLKQGAGIQKGKKTGFRIKCGMTEIMVTL